MSGKLGQPKTSQQDPKKTCFEIPASSQEIAGNQDSPWIIVPGDLELTRSGGDQAGNGGWQNGTFGQVEYSRDGGQTYGNWSQILGGGQQQTGIPILIRNMVTGTTVSVVFSLVAGAGSPNFEGVATVTFPQQTFECLEYSDGSKVCCDALGNEVEIPAEAIQVRCPSIRDLIDQKKLVLTTQCREHRIARNEELEVAGTLETNIDQNDQQDQLGLVTVSAFGGEQTFTSVNNTGQDVLITGATIGYGLNAFDGDGGLPTMRVVINGQTLQLFPQVGLPPLQSSYADGMFVRAEPPILVRNGQLITTVVHADSSLGGNTASFDLSGLDNDQPFTNNVLFNGEPTRTRVSLSGARFDSEKYQIHLCPDGTKIGVDVTRCEVIDVAQIPEDAVTCEDFSEPELQYSGETVCYDRSEPRPAGFVPITSLEGSVSDNNFVVTTDNNAPVIADTGSFTVSGNSTITLTFDSPVTFRFAGEGDGTSQIWNNTNGLITEATTDGTNWIFEEGPDSNTDMIVLNGQSVTGHPGNNFVASDVDWGYIETQGATTVTFKSASTDAVRFIAFDNGVEADIGEARLFFQGKRAIYCDSDTGLELTNSQVETVRDCIQPDTTEECVPGLTGEFQNVGGNLGDGQFELIGTSPNGGLSDDPNATDYVVLKGGSPPPSGEVYYSGFDSAGGGTSLGVTLNTPIELDSRLSEFRFAYDFYNFVALGSNLGVNQTDVPITVVTDVGPVTIIYSLTNPEKEILRDGGWFEFDETFQIPDGATQILGYQLILENNTQGGAPTTGFDPTNTEVFAVAPIGFFFETYEDCISTVEKCLEEIKKELRTTRGQYAEKVFVENGEVIVQNFNANPDNTIDNATATLADITAFFDNIDYSLTPDDTSTQADLSYVDFVGGAGTESNYSVLLATVSLDAPVDVRTSRTQNYSVRIELGENCGDYETLVDSFNGPNGTVASPPVTIPAGIHLLRITAWDYDGANGNFNFQTNAAGGGFVTGIDGILLSSAEPIERLFEGKVCDGSSEVIDVLTGLVIPGATRREVDDLGEIRELLNKLLGQTQDVPEPTKTCFELPGESSIVEPWDNVTGPLMSNILLDQNTPVDITYLSTFAGDLTDVGVSFGPTGVATMTLTVTNVSTGQTETETLNFTAAGPLTLQNVVLPNSIEVNEGDILNFDLSSTGSGLFRGTPNASPFSWAGGLEGRTDNPTLELTAVSAADSFTVLTDADGTETILDADDNVVESLPEGAVEVDCPVEPQAPASVASTLCFDVDDPDNPGTSIKAFKNVMSDGTYGPLTLLRDICPEAL